MMIRSLLKSHFESIKLELLDIKTTYYTGEEYGLDFDVLLLLWLSFKFLSYVYCFNSQGAWYHCFASEKMILKCYFYSKSP